MKVILKENIKGVGKKDEVINASDGYARNYLFPKNLALEATKENMSKLKAKEDSNKYKKSIEKLQAEEMASKINKCILKIKMQAGENGKIFGGVTSKEVSDELKKQHNIEVDKKKIIINETIKTLGTFIIDIKLYEGVIGKLKLNIEAM